MDLAAKMKELMAFVVVSLTAGETHWDVWRMAADKCDLWEDDHFPLWLSFIVAGQMREMGFEE